MSAHALFAYGTLRFPEMMRAIVGRVPENRLAVLADHACYLARHGRFPGVLPAVGQRVEGRLYVRLEEGLLTRLDDFKGVFFERRLLAVSNLERDLEAWVYMPTAQGRRLLSRRRFDAEAFASEALPGWRLRLRSEEP